MSTKFLIITEEVLLDHSVNQSTLDTDLNLLDNGKRGPGLIEINILVTFCFSEAENPLCKEFYRSITVLNLQRLELI